MRGTRAPAAALEADELGHSGPAPVAPTAGRLDTDAPTGAAPCGCRFERDPCVHRRVRPVDRSRARARAPDVPDASSAELYDVSLDGVRARLGEWLSSGGPAPIPADTAFVARFLADTVRHGNSELAYLAARFLDRYGPPGERGRATLTAVAALAPVAVRSHAREASLGPAWAEAVRACVHAVQVEAVRRHGRPLRL